MVNISIAALSVQDGLTFKEVIEDIPTDGASIFVYVLVVLSAGLVAWGNPKKGRPLA